MQGQRNPANTVTCSNGPNTSSTATESIVACCYAVCSLCSGITTIKRTKVDKAFYTACCSYQLQIIQLSMYAGTVWTVSTIADSDEQRFSWFPHALPSKINPVTCHYGLWTFFVNTAKNVEIFMTKKSRKRLPPIQKVYVDGK